eukprot:6063278-Amphidinium_carterae.1
MECVTAKSVSSLVSFERFSPVLSSPRSLAKPLCGVRARERRRIRLHGAFPGSQQPLIIAGTVWRHQDRPQFLLLNVGGATELGLRVEHNINGYFRRDNLEVYLQSNSMLATGAIHAASVLRQTWLS